MPSTRKQKAKDKRSRQSDVMSDIENLDVMLGNYPDSEVRDQNSVEQVKIDPESGRQQQNIGPSGDNYRTLLNTNLSENKDITVETSRMINSEILSLMSRKSVEMKSDLNSHILEVLNTAIEEKILPSIENALACNREVRDAKWDLQPDQQTQELEENFPTTSGNQKDHYRENLVNSDEGDDDGYDMRC